jgi:hypothetical protein
VVVQSSWVVGVWSALVFNNQAQNQSVRVNSLTLSLTLTLSLNSNLLT